MEIKEVKSEEEWEGFLGQCREKTFLQSWNWGEFNLAMGNKMWRLGVCLEEKIIAVALVLKTEARRATFLFVPHGPAVVEELPAEIKKEILQSLAAKLKALAKEEKAIFIRISPLFSRSEENEKIFADLGFKQAPMHSSAYEATLKLDISQKEDDLLKNMRKTTRYLIKKAEKEKNIEIIKSDNSKDIEAYQKLNKDVSKRQGFVPFSKKAIKNEFDVFLNERKAILLFGKYNGEIAAGALVIFWQGIGFYHQAASLGKFARFSIPYLLLWEAIREAKNRGCAVYDFWGFVDPEKFPRHPWAGPTLFKMGFGGHKQEYVKTQDYIISSKYWINYMIEKARKFKRGL